jgi:predicted nucleic acid-binding protein
MGFNLKAAGETNRRVEDQKQRDEAARADTFRQKVAIQQFMNSNGPIFRAFANRGVLADDVMQSGVLNALIGNAVALANETASRLYNKPRESVTAAEAKPFRVGAAEWVAAHWTGGKQLDVEVAADQIATAAAMVDGGWDHDIYKDTVISDDASKHITAAAVAGSLIERVSIYSFRIDTPIVIYRLINEVMSEATKSAREMLPAATESEVANLTQTIARTLSNLMQACYDQKSREVVKALYKKSEAEKLAFLETHQPLDEVIRNFRNWAEWLAWISPQAANRLNKASKPSVEVEDAASEMHPD